MDTVALTHKEAQEAVRAFRVLAAQKTMKRTLRWRYAMLANAIERRAFK